MKQKSDNCKINKNPYNKDFNSLFYIINLEKHRMKIDHFNYSLHNATDYVQMGHLCSNLSLLSTNNILLIFFIRHIV